MYVYVSRCVCKRWTYSVLYVLYMRKIAYKFSWVCGFVFLCVFVRDFRPTFLSPCRLLDLYLLPSLTSLLKKHIITHTIVSVPGSPDINHGQFCFHWALENKLTASVVEQFVLLANNMAIYNTVSNRETLTYSNYKINSIVLIYSLCTESLLTSNVCYENANFLIYCKTANCLFLSVIPVHTVHMFGVLSETLQTIFYFTISSEFLGNLSCIFS